jgi:putative endonuclease
MSDSYNFGKIAEQEAVIYLLNKGYTILAKNYFFQKAEIDIIAEIANQICIIEVKARSYNAIQEPFEAVNSKKIKLLLKAADYYIRENNIDLEVRFDIISIIKNNKNIQIEHIENAFDIF